MALQRKLGKKAAKFDNRTLQFGSYLTPKLAVPPPRVDWSRGFNFDWGMMLNDQLGCCVESAKGHAQQIWTMDNGRLVTVPDSTILGNYEANGGYVQGDTTTDNGENELDSLKAWRNSTTAKSGLVGLNAFAAINPQTQGHVQQGIWLFGFAYIGFSVPQSAMDQNAQGKPWTVVANDGGIVGGHAVIVPMYDNPSNMLTCITWGARQQLTWDFWQRYVDEAYILLSPSWLNKRGVDPSGFDMASLQADLTAVTG